MDLSDFVCKSVSQSLSLSPLVLFIPVVRGGGGGGVSSNTRVRLPSVFLTMATVHLVHRSHASLNSMPLRVATFQPGCGSRYETLQKRSHQGRFLDLEYSYEGGKF